MSRAPQVTALLRVETRQLPAAAVLAALGIVYGDIGTSPLYAFKQAAAAGGTLSRETVMGVVSLILWSLILIVSVKYAILIMRADNHGEGGIVALLALLDVRHAPPRSLRAFLLIVGLIGAALLYGDGVITPAISVLSAVEGLKLDAPRLAPVVVPISVAILVGLFVIIAQYLRMSHYGLAGFGTVAAYAGALGMKDDAAKLKSIAGDIYKADEYTSTLAERSEHAAANRPDRRHA